MGVEYVLFHASKMKMLLTIIIITLLFTVLLGTTVLGQDACFEVQCQILEVPLIDSKPKGEREDSLLSTPFRFTFDDEETNISAYVDFLGNKAEFPYMSFILTDREFGYVANETFLRILQDINLIDNKIIYQIDSNQNYVRNKNNPLVLEHNLSGTTTVINQIGLPEERQNKRFLSFEKIRDKFVNRFDERIEEVNLTECLIENETTLVCLKSQVIGTINITIKTPRETDITFVEQGISWLIQFFNLFDLDPSFIDGTDTNWDAGTLSNFEVLGTGSDANLSSTEASGHFASQVFDAGSIANWTNITINTEAHYETEIGRASGDKVDASLPFVNTSGLIVLYHFNNESEFLEGNSFELNNTYDFSVDVNSERVGEARFNGSFIGDATINFTDTFLGTGTLELTAEQPPGSHIFVGTLPVTGWSAFSYSAWIHADATKNNHRILSTTFSGGDDIRLFISTTPNLVFALDDTSVSQVTFPFVDKENWHYAVGTYDGTTIRLYLDGVEVGTPTTDTFNFAGTNGNTFVGKRDFGLGSLYNGTIDETSIWNRSLGAAEVLNLYKRGAWRVNVSVRTCDDNACDGETYTNIQPNNITAGFKVPINLTTTQQFVQYNITYGNKSAVGVNVVVNNVSIEYELIALKNFTSLVDENGARSIFNAIGTKNQTKFNITIDAIQLDPAFGNGTYVSQVFDLSSSQPFQNISWTEAVPYQREIGRADGRDGNTLSVEQRDTTGGINTSGLVLLMHFNNESDLGEATEDGGGLDNTVLDYSVDANSERSGSVRNNGTFINGATINKTDFIFGGGSAEFDGVDDEITIPNFDPHTQGTVAFWMKTDGLPPATDSTRQRMFGGADAYEILIINDAGTIAIANDLFAAGLDDLISNFAPEIDVWFHLVSTYDTSDGAMEIYIDGVLDNSNTNANDDPGSFTLTLGRRTGNTQFYNGTMDELSVWNRTLSADEVRNLYLRGAIKLNISARTCDDAACDGEDFSLNVGNSTKSDISSLTDNQFIQYRAEYDSDPVGNTIQMYNVTIHYGTAAVGDTTNPIINGTLNQTLTSIIQNSVINATFNITDESASINGTIVINNTGEVRFFNFSFINYVSGNQEISQNFTISETAGTRINITGIAIDNNSNRAQKEIIITVAAEDSCSCPSSGDFEVIDGDVCTIATLCDVRPNSFRVLDGKMRITSSGQINADGCYIDQEKGSFFVETGGGYFCGEA